MWYLLIWNQLASSMCKTLVTIQCAEYLLSMIRDWFSFFVVTMNSMAPGLEFAMMTSESKHSSPTLLLKKPKNCTKFVSDSISVMWTRPLIMYANTRTSGTLKLLLKMLKIQFWNNSKIINTVKQSS